MALSLAGLSCNASSADLATFPDPAKDLALLADAGPQKIVLAGGCFWCTEGVFEHIPGVTDVVSGYAGGSKETANYEAVCTGTTGHAEAIQITYDPTKVTYGHLLKAFFSVAHDPTELNRQGPDRGTQYRSAIFYSNDAEKNVADAYIKQLTAAKVFDAPIVTTLEPLKAFYPAEQDHQDFVRLHPTKPYVVLHALEKIKKAEKFAAMPTTKPATEPAK
jgi:peptide-methionine (S)-S-oxide reductase